MANVGRPRKYNTAEELQEAIDVYFEEHKPEYEIDSDGKVITTKSGIPILKLNPPTISGLALHLGFCNRTSLYEYEREGEFSDTIKIARTRCENFVESYGMSGNIPPAIAIFALKNYGWKDTQEIIADVQSKIVYLDKQDADL